MPARHRPLPRPGLTPPASPELLTLSSSTECFRHTPREGRGQGTPRLPSPSPQRTTWTESRSPCLTEAEGAYRDGGCANAQTLSQSHRSGFVPASDTHCQAGKGCQGPGDSPWVTGREVGRWWLCHWPEPGDPVLSGQPAAAVTGRGAETETRGLRGAGSPCFS